MLGDNWDSAPDEDWFAADLQQGEQYSTRLSTKNSLPERLQATQLKILGIHDPDGNAISRTASAGAAGKESVRRQLGSAQHRKVLHRRGNRGHRPDRHLLDQHHEETSELTGAPCREQGRRRGRRQKQSCERRRMGWLRRGQLAR